MAREDVVPGTRPRVDLLPSAGNGVLSVRPQSTLEKAETLMLLNDYSQLAVQSGERTLDGAVTWKSIVRSRMQHANPAFCDVIVPAKTVQFDDDLLPLLSVLFDEEFVFVRDREQKISGIVTNADLNRLYGDLADPFLHIGEIDTRLRRIIARCFTFDEVRRFCDPDGERELRSFDDLTMGDCQRFLGVRRHWSRLGWWIDRKVFVEQLDEVRRLRNCVVHFHPPPISEAEVDRLRSFAEALRVLG